MTASKPKTAGKGRASKAIGFTQSQVYEDLLLKMGEKNSDGGQFFSPREVVRTMVRTLDPQPGETVYDPCCGTGGFLAQGYDYLARKLGDSAASTALERLKHDTFFGREKENPVFPIALANPPFGGKEGVDTQKRYDFTTSSTQVLFMQHILQELKQPDGERSGGRCGVVLDEGLLFRTNESAFVETKRKLLDECDLWCIVSLPGGVFSTAGAGVKTNLLFFTRGKKTERIWYSARRPPTATSPGQWTSPPAVPRPARRWRRIWTRSHD